MKIICLLSGHKFDAEKYKNDLEYYYNFNNYIHLTTQEVLKHIENDPKPYCVRCKREI